MKTSRSVGNPALKMERAYVDKESGRVSCCWTADNRDQVASLFKKAGVLFETITTVEEATAADFT